MTSTTQTQLPLTVQTPEAWVAHATADLLELLNDHGHLERKAASNALDLLPRWPDPVPPETWTQTLTAVARDEVEHLQAVVRLLNRRGSLLSKHHKNPYAAGLRKMVRLGDGSRELVDRLMVSALIEARSCERFALLADLCEDAELAKLYRALWASEHGHYRVFVQLAEPLGTPLQIEQRWREMLEAEGTLITQQPPGARMHSWFAG
ncbi:MAG: tRNA isopentenyl-2-thiomethyl-A-37 hydroxylase MiaE [Phycisphaeraceae bacterium]